MKIILDDEEVKEALKSYLYKKMNGTPEIIVSSKGDSEFECLVDYTSTYKS